MTDGGASPTVIEAWYGDDYDLRLFVVPYEDHMVWYAWLFSI